jgi:Family of unknown function (DUF6220)
MSTSATGASTSAPPRSTSPTAFVITARVTLVLIAVQFGLAGLGAFRGLHGKDTNDGWWAPHSMLGYGIALLTLVLLVLALVSKLGRPTVTWTAIAAALTVIGQPLLAALGDKASPWFGLLHALDGVAIAALLGIVAARVTAGAASRPH